MQPFPAAWQECDVAIACLLTTLSSMTKTVLSECDAPLASCFACSLPAAWGAAVGVPHTLMWQAQMWAKWLIPYNDAVLPSLGVQILGLGQQLSPCGSLPKVRRLCAGKWGMLAVGQVSAGFCA